MALQVSVLICLGRPENRNSNFGHTPIVAPCSNILRGETAFPTLGKLDHLRRYTGAAMFIQMFVLLQDQVQVQPKVQVKVPAGWCVMQYYMLSDQFADMRLARQTLY